MQHNPSNSDVPDESADYDDNDYYDCDDNDEQQEKDDENKEEDKENGDEDEDGEEKDLAPVRRFSIASYLDCRSMILADTFHHYYVTDEYTGLFYR